MKLNNKDVYLSFLKGDKGDSITSMRIETTGLPGVEETRHLHTLYYTLNDGTEHLAGTFEVDDGKAGEDGEDAKKITSFRVESQDLSNLGVEETLVNIFCTLEGEDTEWPCGGFQIPHGKKGDKGDKGDTGDTGATPDITITAESLDAGSTPTVTKSGTAEAPSFALGIPKGDKGDTGEKGDKGDKGDTGEKGDQGTSITGLHVEDITGTPEADGSMKHQLFYDLEDNTHNSAGYIYAPQGPQGEKGDTGATGETGATPVITMTATSLEAGSTPTVTKSGTDEAPSFVLGIPKGDKGDTGEKGEKGDAGANGLDSVSVTGSGNAVTAASYDTTTRALTLTKGSTFLTSAPVSSVAGNTGAVTASQLVSAILTGENSYGDKIVAKKLEENGYIRFASGLKIQWGYVSNGSSAYDWSKIITFSVTFTVKPTVLASAIEDSGSGCWAYVKNPSIYGATLRQTSKPNANGKSTYIYWVAIGY